jgi:hypothetical protein
MKRNDLFRVAYWGDYQRRPNVMAAYTGYIRPPMAGEFFLSGAIVEAYYTAFDMTTPHHIAKLVKVEQSTRIVGDYKETP